ncbi:hypothetical protein PRIPAC_84690, partial [Pristionchus pacificus]
MHPLVLASQLWQYYQHQQQLHEQLQQLQQLTAAMVQGYLNNLNAMSTFALAPPATPSPATPELPSYHQQMAGIVNQNSFTNLATMNSFAPPTPSPVLVITELPESPISSTESVPSLMSSRASTPHS